MLRWTYSLSLPLMLNTLSGKPSPSMSNNLKLTSDSEYDPEAPPEKFIRIARSTTRAGMGIAICPDRFPDRLIPIVVLNSSEDDGLNIFASNFVRTLSCIER